jgi:hypothetical protein
MTGWRQFCYVLPLLATSVGWAQDTVETNLYLAFNKGGPIAIGRVASVDVKTKGADYENGTLTLEVTEQLRGEALPQSLTVPFGWADPNSPSYSFTYAKRPPPQGFDRILPVAGMRVLLMYPRRKPTAGAPLAVLNLDSGEEAWIPVIRRALAMTALTGAERTNTLLGGLSDPKKFIRVVAMHRLLEGPECVSGSTCRDKAVEILGKRAKAGPEIDRLEAVEWLEHQFYDAPARDTTSNRQIISTLFALVTDQNSNVRKRAIGELDQVFSPDMNWRPSPAQVNISNPEDVARVLEEEQKEGGESAQRAKRVAMAIGSSK